MNRKLATAALALTAAAALAGCSGGATAAPAATVTVTATPQATTSATPLATTTPTPGTPAPPPAGSGVTGALDPAAAAFDNAKTVVTNLLNGQKVSATNSMTPEAAAVVKGTNVKDYMLGGRVVKTCQVNPSELKLQKPKAADNTRPFTTNGAALRPDARVTAVEVLCDSASFGFIVATLGPDHLVDGIEYRILPNDEIFVPR